MTLIPVQLPFGGFTEQSQFSAIPQGMTPSCLNVMPIDPFNKRTRIGQRHGTKSWNTGAVQFIGTYRVYEGGTNFVEKIIFVRNGLVYWADPNDDTGTATLFGGQGSGALLSTTALVEGVQFNNYFYFVDGTNYVFVDLVTPAGSSAVDEWGGLSGGGGGGTNHGPYHTDPAGAGAGDRATLICRWGARLVLAGYRTTPNVWYACAIDAPYPYTGSSGSSGDDGWTGSDWLGAISGSTYSDYGTLGDPIVCIFPFGQTGLMFGCTNSIGYMTSDPEFDPNAALVSLTKSIGVVGQRAWCQGQEKSAYLLGKDGLYQIVPNDFNFSRANRVSAGRLDSFFLRLDFGTPAIGGSSELAGGTLRGLQTTVGSGSGADSKTIDEAAGELTDAPTDLPVKSTVAVGALIGNLDNGEVFPVLCWDNDREGVWIFLSVSGVERQSVHLYYDTKTNSFWPQRFYDPNMYAPIAVVYVPQNRVNTGKMFLGTDAAISLMDNGYAVGVDGYSSELTEQEQQAQLVRSSLTIGPIIAPLPYRLMLSEVRVDLGDDVYETPSGFTSLEVGPILSVVTGETAQAALGLQTDTIFVNNLNALVVDGGDAPPTVSPSNTYDGGDVSAPSPSILDGRFANRPFGDYQQRNPFDTGTDRVFDGPWNWLIYYDDSVNNSWVLALDAGGGSYLDEYVQNVPDIGTPNGQYTTDIQIPVSPDIKDVAIVSGSSFASSSVTEIGVLNEGRNEAIKCRIRSEAMYLTLASDGKPWSIERMSVQAQQVGKSRGST
jgi:hypothetical protein